MVSKCLAFGHNSPPPILGGCFYRQPPPGDVGLCDETRSVRFGLELVMGMQFPCVLYMFVVLPHLQLCVLRSHCGLCDCGMHLSMPCCTPQPLRFGDPKSGCHICNQASKPIEIMSRCVSSTSVRHSQTVRSQVDETHRRENQNTGS